MKRSIVMLILLMATAVFAGVVLAQDDRTDDATTPVMLDRAVIAGTSQLFFDSLNAGDIETWLTTLAEDAVSFEPVGTPPNVGHEGLLAWVGSQAGFESVTTKVNEIIVAGNSAAILWTSTFVLPGGAEIVLDGVDVHEYNDAGLIQIVEGYFDPSPIFAAIE